ncbi:hypothetical protein [Mesobacillus zeae]|uniref:hypothetical protein n=1 Tax=Mesobacillus zeae TaxID=1917180 RepID=UPI0015E7A0D5|nr:hypothetical protein [Mesobacillus zeae]
MITFLPNKDESTIAFEFTGKATPEDSEKLNSQFEQRYGDISPSTFLFSCTLWTARR